MTIEHFEESYEVGSDAKLIVKNIRGKVTVLPGAEGTIKVKAEKVLDGCNVDDLRLKVFQEENGTVTARVQQPERYTIFGSYRPCEVNFEIEAPPTTDLLIKTVSAPVSASGFSGEVTIKTVSGSQKLENINGVLDLNSLSGKILGDQLQGEANISTVSSLLRLTESSFSSLRAKNVSGRIEAQTELAEGPYHFSSVSGEVKLVIPEESNCEVQACSVSGRFYTDLDLRSSVLGNRSWRVTIGEGGVPVRIKTVSGRMSVLSAFDATGSRPGYIQQSKAERTSVLNKLSDGELSVEEALIELS